MPRDIRLYLDDIVEAIDRILDYVGKMNFAQFAADQKTIDAVVRNLEIIGEAARNLPEETRISSREMEWRKIVGLRNVLIHQYFGINNPIVWDVVQNKLGRLKSTCEKRREIEPEGGKEESGEY